MHCSLEGLEQRQLLSVSMDSAGWTQVTPSADTRTIYVSNSTGSDTNSGLSQSSPIKTLSKAQSLVRAGMPDWVLLKRGDTFESFGEWRKWGRSAQEPIFISNYGTGARPVIDSGTSFGFVTYGRNGATGQSIDNMVFSGLTFIASGYNGSNGTIDTSAMRLYCQGQNITIEDCRMTGFRENLTLDADYNGLRNVTIRRNVLLDAYSTTTAFNAHGMWIGGTTNNITIEQNVIDHNGWRDGMDAERTFFNHNLYIYNGAQGVTVKDNLITRASFYGIKMNGGGTATNNFFARNSESIYLESNALLDYNVFTEAVPMPLNNWGVAINTQKAPSATIRNNLVTKNDNTNASGVAGIQLFNNGTPFSGLVENNVIYNWRNGIRVATPGNGAGSVIIRNNQSQLTNSSSAALDQSLNGPQSTFSYSGNKYFSLQGTGANRISGTFQSLSNWKTKTGETNAQYVQLSYPEPSRSISGYAASVSAGTTFEIFIAAARLMDRSTWNTAFMAPAVNNWFRAGFGMAGPTAAPISGDSDGDGKVTTSDFNLLVANFGGSNKTFAQGDFNGDGFVNSADFTIFLSQYGKSAASPAPTPFAGDSGDSGEDGDAPLI